MIVPTKEGSDRCAPLLVSLVTSELTLYQFTYNWYSLPHGTPYLQEQRLPLCPSCVRCTQWDVTQETCFRHVSPHIDLTIDVSVADSGFFLLSLKLDKYRHCRSVGFSPTLRLTSLASGTKLLIWKASIKVIYLVVNRYTREGNGTPFLYPCLENPMDGGAW